MIKEITRGRRYLGYIDTEKKIFVTKRNEREHYFRLWEGLGFNTWLIDGFIETEEVKEVQVEYETIENENQLLITTPMTIAIKGYEWKNDKDIRDPQYILALKYFEKKQAERNEVP